MYLPDTIMKNKLFSILFLSVILGLIGYVYRDWFRIPEIIGGDWPYYFKENLDSFTLYPSLWVPWAGNGTGGLSLLLGLQLFVSTLVVIGTQWLGLSWLVVYKAGWFGGFILLSIVSFRALLREVLPKALHQFWPIGSLIFVVNTYALMLVSGGQMGVALAYSVTPLVLASFVRLQRHENSQHPNLKSIIIATLILGFQMTIDLRIAYVTIIAALIHIAVTLGLKREKQSIRVGTLFVDFFVPITIAVFLNAFWLLPQVMLETNPVSELGAAYTSIGSVKFFSFADFSHALSFLQPNWPENIFGKTYFLQPEFLVIPILAFANLLFVKRSKQFTIHNSLFTIQSFALLGIIGAFLSKGANEPFGFMYLWLFEHVPGFVMFRDPTKWFVFVALSYSVLVPTVIYSAGEWIEKKYPRLHMHSRSLSIFFILFWVILHRQAFLGQLPGTFVERHAPQVYETYKTFMLSKRGFFRTLWVPRQSRFTFATPLNTAMEAEPLFEATDAATLAVQLGRGNAREHLAVLGVRYLIVPADQLGELFVNDRKYDEAKRSAYLDILDDISWLTKIRDDELVIYETPSYKDIFWIEGEEPEYTLKQYSFFEVIIHGDKPTKLFFSQTYDPGWVAKQENGGMIPARKTDSGLMVFEIPAGVQRLTIFFRPQVYVWWGAIVTVVILTGCITILVLSIKLNYNK